MILKYKVPVNRLKDETSPYLLAHATNPVDWYPWGKEAIARATAENKPILLSIGYSACHFCHVMAYESFEDEETAQLMNALYINIKVDREERPDLDVIYQLTHHIITERPGGWPLTLFLVPDTQLPFYAGTYFPAHAATMNFKTILKHIAHSYQTQKTEILNLTTELKKALEQLAQPLAVSSHTSPIAPEALALSQFKQEMDKHNGGLGDAPKFPHTPALEFLLAHKDTAEFVHLSLKNMAQKGLYDQLGGGFFRYAVDANWTIPHFEKMLYDNALLITLYSKAYQHKQNPLYQRIVTETITWLQTQLHSPHGGFYAALQADSEGSEGKYYVWDKQEIQKILTPEHYTKAAYYFGLDASANFKEHYHLLLAHDNINPAALQDIKSLLLNARNTRIPPGTDDKIMTGWNALLIKALVIAGETFHQPAYIDCALATAETLILRAWHHNRLYTSHKNNIVKYTAYLDDYAYFLDALVTLTEYHHAPHLNDFTEQLADQLIDLFFDAEKGGFYFTARDHETLIQRPKLLLDDATPSGNAIACDSLIRLSRYLEKPLYLEAAQKTLAAAEEALRTYPAAHVSLLLARKTLKA